MGSSSFLSFPKLELLRLGNQQKPQLGNDVKSVFFVPFVLFVDTMLFLG